MEFNAKIICSTTVLQQLQALLLIYYHSAL